MQGSVNLTPEGATHLPRIRLIYGLILQRKKARAKNIIATVLILQKLFPQIFQCVIVARSEKY